MNSSDFVKDGWQAGLWKIIPSGATNGTVGATGDVTIGSAVSSVTVSGAFSSKYENYRVLVNGGVGSATQAISLRLGAVTTGYYGAQIAATFGGVVSAAGFNNTANFTLAGVSTANSNFMSFDLLSPFLSKRTGAHGSYINADSTGNAGTFTGFQNSNTSFTAFTIIVGGTITGGTIRVYGYN
jgi:hypothetical protein